MINHWTHASGGEMDLVASPLKLRGTPVRRDRPPPTMGQHTDEVLHEVLGMDAAELAALRARQII
jgi:crotonobetainyl-CoA:carnitine CoA-transferase CaiB-like acyl-CoA transferase